LSSDKPQKPATKTVTAGRSSSLTGPVVNVPVWRASTHLYENVAALEAGKTGNQDGRFFYGRRGSPTQWSLAEALTEMEPGAHGTMLYPSGVAAIACALLSVLKSGDVLLMTDNAYDPSRSLADGFLKRFGVETRCFVTARKRSCWSRREA
jgi:cystathionine beta-lyase